MVRGYGISLVFNFSWFQRVFITIEGPNGFASFVTIAKVVVVMTDLTQHKCKYKGKCVNIPPFDFNFEFGQSH